MLIAILPVVTYLQRPTAGHWKNPDINLTTIAYRLLKLHACEKDLGGFKLPDNQVYKLLYNLTDSEFRNTPNC